MKNSGFRARAISAVVLVAVLLAAGIIGGNLLLFFTVIVSFVGLMELYRAVGVFDKGDADNKNNLLAFAGFIITAIYYLVFSVGGTVFPSNIRAIDFNANLYDMVSYPDLVAEYVSMGRITWILIIIVLAFGLFMSIYVFTFPRFTIEQVAYAFIGVVYVPIFMSFIYMIRVQRNGAFLIWLIFISSWICDTCAYLVGSSIGKHKMAPVLSPKKSVEGAVGGVLGSIIVAFVFGYFVEYKLFSGELHTIVYMIICGVGAVVSQVGDLAASAIKRNKDIKDYGTLIPGHGGIMDRFDSVIFVTPFIYILCAVLFK